MGGVFCYQEEKNMPADGMPITNRLDGTTERKLHAKVIDNVLNAPTMASRVLSKAGLFQGKTMDWTVDITQSDQFEWFTGVPTLNSAAEDTAITLTYAPTAGSQPKVGIMLESFANAGQTGTIPLDAYKYGKASQEVIRNVATAIFGTGSGDQPNGFQAIVDNGTNAGTIGGQSRTTYDALDCGAYTDSGGVVSLAKLGTLDDAAAKGSELGAVPGLNVTTFTVWSLVEQLLDPNVRANYEASGFPRLAIRGDGTTSKAALGGAAGFVSLHHRGMPLLKDKFATTGVFYKLNEDSYGYFGLNTVPQEYKDLGIRKVNLGSMEAYESLAAKEGPSEFNGFFYQPPMMMPDQPGTIARFYVMGQMATFNPRLNAQLHSITGI